MTGTTHGLIGVCGAFGLSRATRAPLEESAVMVGVALAASGLPDVDSKLPLAHRGPTHYLLTAALLTVLVAVGAWRFAGPEFDGSIVAGFACGYLLHILADMSTVTGVRALSPFTRRRLWLLPRRLRFRYDGVREHVLAGVLMLALVGGVVGSL